MENTNGVEVIENIVSQNENEELEPINSVNWGYDCWQDSHR